VLRLILLGNKDVLNGEKDNKTGMIILYFKSKHFSVKLNYLLTF